MINAGIAGLGWWGKTLVEGVSNGQSDEIHFVAGSARTHTDDIKAFAKQQKFELYNSYEEMLKHPKVDAVVLATPHSLHVEQVVQAAESRSTCSARSRSRSRRGRARSRRRGREGRRHAGPRLQPPLASRDDEAAQPDRLAASSA